MQPIESLAASLREAEIELDTGVDVHAARLRYPDLIEQCAAEIGKIVTQESIKALREYEAAGFRFHSALHYANTHRCLNLMQCVSDTRRRPAGARYAVLVERPDQTEFTLLSAEYGVLPISFRRFGPVSVSSQLRWATAAFLPDWWQALTAVEVRNITADPCVSIRLELAKLISSELSPLFTQ